MIGKPLLHYAVLHCKKENVAWLLKNNEPIDQQDEKGNSALHEAVLNGDLEKVKLLLRYDATPDLLNNKGRAPLHFAAEDGDIEIVSALLAAGASVFQEDCTGETPLSLAKKGKHEDHKKVICALVAKQPKIGRDDPLALDVDSEGETEEETERSDNSLSCR